MHLDKIEILNIPNFYCTFYLKVLSVFGDLNFVPSSDFKIYNFKTIQNILENSLDKIPMEHEKEEDQDLPDHGNIRGKNYYN